MGTKKMDSKIDEMKDMIINLTNTVNEMKKHIQKKVLFSARKKTEGKFHGKLTYDTIDVNVGDGLQANGNFIAPESGTYGFTFSGLTASVNGRETLTGVTVYRDDGKFNDIFRGNPGHSANNINSSWMMKLAKGQVV